jgi:hypothetical protein
VRPIRPWMLIAFYVLGAVTFSPSLSVPNIPWPGWVWPVDLNRAAVRDRGAGRDDLCGPVDARRNQALGKTHPDAISASSNGPRPTTASIIWTTRTKNAADQRSESGYRTPGRSPTGRIRPASSARTRPAALARRLCRKQPKSRSCSTRSSSKNDLRRNQLQAVARPSFRRTARRWTRVPGPRHGRRPEALPVARADR